MTDPREHTCPACYADPVTTGDRRVACPACYAPAGKPCTAPTDTGRREVAWHHFARSDAAAAAAPAHQE